MNFSHPQGLLSASCLAWVLTLMEASVPAQEPMPPGPMRFFPLIRSAGGVVAVPQAAQPPRAGIKVVFDITAGAQPGEVNKGLERVARLLNLYAASGLKASDVTVALVLHGEATKAALTDAAYQARLGMAQNPNLPVLRELQQAGVALYVCGQALAYQGISQQEVAPPLRVAVAALTVVLNHQADGYACISVP